MAARPTPLRGRRTAGARWDRSRRAATLRQHVVPLRTRVRSSSTSSVYGLEPAPAAPKATARRDSRDRPRAPAQQRLGLAALPASKYSCATLMSLAGPPRARPDFQQQLAQLFADFQRARVDLQRDVQGLYRLRIEPQLANDSASTMALRAWPRAVERSSDRSALRRLRC
jgi:hypothetical protein